ncbi:DUF1003 domain-containing protein [Candidatus Uhrbacteria bacterium]|nr:DUF1003 domain-containing protein [Candidatus Uhrbacteria bacterium]
MSTLTPVSDPSRDASFDPIVPLRQRSGKPAERIADFFTEIFGTVWFFILNGVFFFAWIYFNTPSLSGAPALDPYPFGFLTMVVSLEAIFLSIIVLISQNRSAKVEDLREEVDFQVNVQAEREITRILNMLDRIEHTLNIAHDDDPDFERMTERLDVDRLEKAIVHAQQNGKRTKAK